jgi:hypothetical protein
MTHETLQTIFIIVAAVALLIQAVVLVAVALLVFKIRKPVQSIAADVSEVSGIARQRAQQLDPIVGEISRIVLTRTEHADAFAKEILDKGHLQVVSADRIVSDILQRVETVTHETGTRHPKAVSRGLCVDKRRANCSWICILAPAAKNKRTLLGCLIPPEFMTA